MTPVITPTIFVSNLSSLKERLELYENLVSRVQLDVADESFAVNPTLSLEKMLNPATTLERDVHLMTEEPIDWLELCAEEGVNLVIGQIEHMSHQAEFMTTAKDLNLKVGLAVDLETEFKELAWPAAKAADLILIMAVRAGQEKQQFNPQALRRVEELRSKGFAGEICVDGGVNESTIKACIKAGVDVLAVGSALWQAVDVGAKLKQLNELMTEKL